MINLRRKNWLKLGLYLVLVGIILFGLYWGLLKFSPQLDSLKKYGYLGVFLAAFITAVTAFIPSPLSVPSFSFAVAMASLLNPYFTILSYSLGGAIGEGVSYFLGFTGRKILADNFPGYKKVEKWIERYGMWWVILFLSFIPLVLFDVIAVISGTLRYSFIKFLFFAFIGRTLRFLILILLLAEAMNRFLN